MHRVDPVAPPTSALGQKAKSASCRALVRFTPVSGHRVGYGQGQLGARSSHWCPCY
jgi:hypothetical protein